MYEDFQYVDMHRAVRDTHYKWSRVNISQVQNIVDKIKDQSDHIYTTIQKFASSEHIDDEVELCNLPFDFDCATDVDLARKQCVSLIDHLIAVYNIDINPDEIMVYYSGNRGFHVTIHYEVFDAQPMVSMIKVWRIVAEHLIKELKLTTADRSVYTKRRAWRVPNTKHGKTNLYKIPLRYDELLLEVDKIRELAIKPAEWLNLEEVI